MGEVIQVHIGQFGTQLGTSLWELYCLEHSIGFDGLVSGNNAQGDLNPFFCEGNNGNYVPRSLFVDCDPDAIHFSVRRGKLSSLFHPNSLVTGKEAACFHTRGAYTIGRQIMDPTMDYLRKMAEKSDNLQGFCLYHSYGGGTGSGFTESLHHRLSGEYGSKLSMVDIGLAPSARMSSVLECCSCFTLTYEVVDTVYFLDDVMNRDTSIFFDNEALYRLASSHLSSTSDIDLRVVNKIIAQYVANLTAPFRFPPFLSSNRFLSSIAFELISHRGLNLLLPSLSLPLSSLSSLEELATNAMDPTQRLVTCPVEGTLFNSRLNFRGVFPLSDLPPVISKIKERVPCWCSEIPGPSHTVTSTPMRTFHEFSGRTLAVGTLTNTTAVRHCLKKWQKHFEKLYNKRAFYHWYVGEGLSGDYHKQTLESLKNLIDVYKSFETRKI